MLAGIKNRLKALENTGRKETPELVLIVFDESDSKWKAQEHYFKYDLKGGVIEGSLKLKSIILESPQSYKPPEGFVGTIVDEGTIL